MTHETLETDGQATTQKTVPQRRTRRRWWFLPVLALIVAAPAYYYFQIAKPPGSGPAGPSVPRVPFSRPWSDRPVVILGVGDSVTAGFGATPGLSYFDRLLDNPPDEYPELKGISLRHVLPNLTARNISVSGSTSPQHLKYQVEPLETFPAEVLGIVCMTTGGNDLIHNYGRTPPRPDAMYGATLEQARPWVAAFADRLESMVTLLNARFPGGCHVYLATIYDPTDGEGDPESVGLPPWPDSTALVGEYNRVITECAARHRYVHLVDMHGAFLGHGIHCTQFWKRHYRVDDPRFWYNPNLEDPNDRGYDALRRLFLLQMIPLREAPSPDETTGQGG